MHADLEALRRTLQELQTDAAALAQSGAAERARAGEAPWRWT